MKTIKEMPKKKVFGVPEWASGKFNCVEGCSNDCKYCYAKAMAIRCKRSNPIMWKEEKLREELLFKSFKKKEGTIMYPTSHDITPQFINEHIIVLRNMLKAGNKILVVSKPHLECIEKICAELAEYKRNILFRFTIGSTDNDVLKFWEPGATSFEERLSCLKYAYKMSFQTSVSIEPALDFNIEKLIEIVLPYVSDAVWVGKANMLIQRLSINGYKDSFTVKVARELIAWQSDSSNFFRLHKKFGNNPKVKWKESVKEVLGIEISTEKGLDI